MSRTIPAPNYAEQVFINNSLQDAIVWKIEDQQHSLQVKSVIVWESLSDPDRQSLIDLFTAYGVSAGSGTFPVTPKAGWHEVNYDGTVVAGNATGLRNDDTVYKVTVTVWNLVGSPAVAVPTKHVVSVVGSAAQTFTDLVTEVNADLVNATLSISGGNLRITNDNTGAGLGVQISNIDALFRNTNGFNGYKVPRNGVSNVTDVITLNRNAANVTFDKAFGIEATAQQYMVILNSTAAGSAENGEWFVVPRLPGRDEIIAQISITDGQADVMLEGRISEEMPAHDLLTTAIDESTGSGLIPLAYIPQIRATTANVASSPSIRVEIHY